mmetsp:Transcript_39240/g.80397  ORF Transcript_39240/g.80397 Transcript_39240/m.80397 type:complete len:204 (+) Transcript_39240:2540-3151(+)
MAENQLKNTRGIRIEAMDINMNVNETHGRTTRCHTMIKLTSKSATFRSRFWCRFGHRLGLGFCRRRRNGRNRRSSSDSFWYGRCGRRSCRRSRRHWGSSWRGSNWNSRRFGCWRRGGRRSRRNDGGDRLVVIISHKIIIVTIVSTTTGTRGTVIGNKGQAGHIYISRRYQITLGIVNLVGCCTDGTTLVGPYLGNDPRRSCCA